MENDQGKFLVDLGPAWGPFLESPGNLPGPVVFLVIKVFNRSQFLLALSTKFLNLITL